MVDLVELAHLAEAWKVPLLVLAFGGLGLMGAGYLSKGPLSHRLRIAGWLAFGLYWPSQAPHYFTDTPSDPVNAWFCLFVPVGAAYLAWHERRSELWKEDPVALRWIAGAVFIAATTYFAIYQFPPITEGLIHFTTWQSSVFANVLFGLDTTIAKDAFGNWNIYIDGQEYAVTVILACTAIQSIMIFVGAIACIQAPRAAKWKALAVSVIPIYVLNLFRNAAIVWGYKVVEWNPFNWGGARPDGWRGWFWRSVDGGLDAGSFEFIHGFVAKFIALGVLVVVALAVFTILPELHGAILDLFDLRKRNRPGFFDPPGKGPSDSPPKQASVSAPEPTGAK